MKIDLRAAKRKYVVQKSNAKMRHYETKYPRLHGQKMECWPLNKGGRQMKVYGCNLDGKFRGVVAAKSKKEAARLMGMTTDRLNKYGCETGNREEISVAMMEPGVAFKRSYAHGVQPYIRMSPPLPTESDSQ